MIREQQPDLFLSLHADVIPLLPGHQPVRGIECFYFTRWSRDPLEQICRKFAEENSAVAFLAWRSLLLLQNTEAPTGLIELGNLENEKERRSLQDPVALKALVQSIGEQVVLYLSRAGKPSGN